MGTTVLYVNKPPQPVVPVPPMDTVAVVECELCGAVLAPVGDAEARHLAWHRLNGLHGHACMALISLQAKHSAGRNGDDVTEFTTDPCSCRLSWATA